MAVSFGMLGILMMLDICFIVNAFVIAALRRWTDKKTAAASRAASTQQEISSKDHSSDILTNNLQGLFNAMKAHEDFAFAWILGTVKLAPLRVKLFPGWKPIPYNLGLCSTSFFVLLGCTLLSPDIITKQVGVASGSLDSDLCVKQDYDHGINDLREHLENITNLRLAKRQHRLMVDFHAALVNDTSLYGTSSHQCPTSGLLSGRKDEWTDSGPFFPGYCEKALEAAVQAAKDRQCVQEICDCPTLPDSAAFRVTGLANRKYCGEVCIDVPYPCPKHTADEEADLADYRLQQYQTAEKQRAEKHREFPTSLPDNLQSTATKTAEKILFQVDVASYVYIGYSCVALFFPTPLVLFRMPYWVAIKQFMFGVQKPFFIVSVVSIWWGLEYFQNLWYSPDIRLFLNNLRAGDPCFVDGEYLIERQKVLNSVCRELIPLEPEWHESVFTISDVLEEVKHFANDCNCSFPNVFLAQLPQLLMKSASYIGFNVTLDLCQGDDDGKDCTILVPDQNVSYFGNSSICIDDEAARQLVLEAPEMNADWYDLWVASGFLATLLVKIAVANFGLSLMKLADPFVVCAGEFLWMPTEFGMDIQSADGQRERVLLDSLGGRGQSLAPSVLQQWYASKRRALFHIGLSKAFLWGLLMHLSLVNLFFAVYDEIGENSSLGQSLERHDILVLGACLSFAAFVAFIGVHTICSLPKIPEVDPGEAVGVEPGAVQSTSATVLNTNSAQDDDGSRHTTFNEHGDEENVGNEKEDISIPPSINFSTEDDVRIVQPTSKEHGHEVNFVNEKEDVSDANSAVENPV
jgi:hypothetical protein